MHQAAVLLADEDVDKNSSSSSSRRGSTFLNVVALGNVGAGKSAVLNSLIGHPILPTRENGATRASICIDLQKDGSLSSKSIILQIDDKSQQARLSKGASGKSRDEIYLKLQTSTAPPLKLVDLPGLDQWIMDETLVSDYAQHNDAILLVIVPAAQAPEIASSRAFKIAKEYDGGGTEHGRSSYCYGQCTLHFSHPWNLDSSEDGQRTWSSWTLLTRLLFLSTL
ncbi:hypothetical protein PVL29_019524 [Vitis rotundifolia]|uniref:Dynamin N-terminal domain-containing protein n=1 Tax=Vitis rotundifolia TaxID=103349 RepID=A0AA38Z0W0_VITRO|nr:hypothetical protein PVL29_019524 [Vitis rotundifolia]